MPTLDELFAAVQDLQNEDQERIRSGLARLIEQVSKSTKGKLVETIRDRWPEHEDAILAALRPVILVSVDRSGSRPRPGATKVGGLPDLPAGSTWPRGEDGRPLSFVVQLDLAACQDLETVLALPDRGFLSLFSSGDPSELSGGRPESSLIYFAEPPENIEALEPPDDLDEEEGIFARVPLETDQGFVVSAANLPPDVIAGVDRVLAKGEGCMLGRPRIRKADLQAVFNPVVDEALLSLEAFGLLRLPGASDSVFGEGAFHLLLDRGDLAEGKLDRARVFFDPGR